MKTTTFDVDTVARLARLEFNEEEKLELSKQMKKIVSFIEKLNELNTKDVPPTFHVLDYKNRFREDRKEPSLTQAQVLENAPRKRGGYFSVPKVIGNRETES